MNKKVGKYWKNAKDMPKYPVIYLQEVNASKPENRKKTEKGKADK